VKNNLSLFSCQAFIHTAQARLSESALCRGEWG
jgi:hypothetical protein